MNKLIYAGALALPILEKVYFPTIPQVQSSHLSTNVQISLPPVFGLVVITNFVLSSVTMVYLSTKVGPARTKYNVKLPQMYAAGDSEDARKFNAVQRGHQQALETYPTFLILSLCSGLVFPAATAALGLLWCVARVKWAEGYALGGADDKPMMRYTHSIWAPHIWTPVIIYTLTTLYGAVGLLMGRTN